MHKTILFIVISIVIFLGKSFASNELDLAVNWMYQNGLTKFSDPNDFMSENNLRRDEATKFFGQYAQKIQKLNLDPTKAECNNYTDLHLGRPDLVETMKNSCRLGLFKGSNGKFMPTDLLTNGQAITVLIRMIDGNKDESQGHFAQKYFEKAEELGILKGLTLSSSLSFDKLATRGEVAKLLYNTSKLNINPTTLTEDNIFKNLPNHEPIINNDLTQNNSLPTSPINVNNVKYENLIVHGIYGNVYKTDPNRIILYNPKLKKTIYFNYYDPEVSGSQKIFSFEMDYKKYIENFIGNSSVSIQCESSEGDYCYGNLRLGTGVGNFENSLIANFVVDWIKNDREILSWKNGAKGYIEKSVKYPFSLVMGEAVHDFNQNSGKLIIGGKFTVNDDTNQKIIGSYLVNFQWDKNNDKFIILDFDLDISDSALIDELRKDKYAVVNTITYVPVLYNSITTSYTLMDRERCVAREQTKLALNGLGRSSYNNPESLCGSKPNI